ncbi:MAG: DNA topoisomerase IV subunit A [Enterococcus sp.]|nr:DNA topoisomerase IV subunit A [Enterococcus sp.]
MVRKSKRQEADDVNPFINPAREIQRNTLENEVESSFLPYAVSVIIDRAIPSAVDGVIPVQRRILYSMYEDGYTPEKNHVKSAKIVGAVIGNYHPHGDSACYGAMVRMAQDFNYELPLVDGHGAFGDQPGADAAAARYTEARLSKEAMLMVEELREEVVDFIPNYDNSRRQPVTLPVKFPNLLINGSKGIAVGFATNMPTHNPGEVIDAARWLLKHPNADLDKLMTFVPGPDFPTGGQIIGQDAIKQAYTTGRGSIKIRATADIESTGRGKHLITFTELPYGVPAEKIIEKIKENLDNGKLQGIVDVKDLTDRRNGIRLVIETKAGVNPNALLVELYNKTPLEDTFGINNIALVDEIPKLVGLKDQLEIFIEHRINVVTKRSQHRKDKKEARLHILEGMLKAIANIDEVIAIVRKAENAEVAQKNLMKRFKIDEIQADYILAINLGRLTKFEKLQLEDEQAKLRNEVAELAKILSDESVLRDVIAKELVDVRKQIDRPRRSVIVGGSIAEHLEESKKAVKALSVEIADEPCTISLSAKGGIVRSASPKRGKGVIATVNTTTRGRFVAVTNKGNAYRIDALHVSEKAASVSSVLPSPLAKGEKVITLAGTTVEDGKTAGLALGTKQGIVKVQALNWPTKTDTFSVINLQDGDEILGARWMEDNTKYDFVFITDDSSLLTFPAEKVRPQGALTAGGVAGIKIADGAEVIDFSVVSADEKESALVVSVSDVGNAKFTPYKLYPAKGRATGGVRSLKFLKGESKVAYSTVTTSPVLVTADGTALEALSVDNRRDGSGKPLGGIPVQ